MTRIPKQHNTETAAAAAVVVAVAPVDIIKLHLEAWCFEGGVGVGGGKVAE